MKTREFSVSGTTAKLVDGLERTVTLVAIVHTDVVTTVKSATSRTQKGKVTTTTITSEVVPVSTNTTVSFGLAVVSPADVPVANAERGIEIARGKALKPKSALAVITTPSQFFTTNMVKLMLAEKLKHIQSDPNRFIRVTGPKATPPATTSESTAARELLQSA